MKTEFYSGTESLMGWFLIPWNLFLAVACFIAHLCGRLPWSGSALFAAIALGGAIQLLCESGRLNPRIFLLPFAVLLELVLMAAALLLSHIDCRRALAIADWATLHLPDVRWYTRKRGAK